MHLIGPNVGSIKKLIGLVQSAFDVTLVNQTTWCAGIGSQSLLQITHIGHPGPGFPFDFQVVHGLFGVLFAIGTSSWLLDPTHLVVGIPVD